MEIRLGDGAVGQGLEGGIAGEEKCKPGAVKRLAWMKCGSAGTNQSTREMMDINMVKCVAVFLQKWSDDLLGRVLQIGNRPVLVSSPIFPRIHDSNLAGFVLPAAGSLMESAPTSSPVIKKQEDDDKAEKREIKPVPKTLNRVPRKFRAPLCMSKFLPSSLSHNRRCLCKSPLFYLKELLAELSFRSECLSEAKNAM
jgi:hypothetical protein